MLVKFPNTKFYENLFSCSKVVTHADRQGDTMMKIIVLLKLFIVNMPKTLCWINDYWRDKRQDEETGVEDMHNTARKQRVQIKSKAWEGSEMKEFFLSDTTLKFVSGWWWWWRKEGKRRKATTKIISAGLHCTLYQVEQVTKCTVPACISTPYSVDKQLKFSLLIAIINSFLQTFPVTVTQVHFL